MKATVKTVLPGFTGNMDDVVIYYNDRLNCMIARRKVMPRTSPSNLEMKALYAFARRIGLSEAFKEDARTYIRLFNRKFRRNNRSHSSWPSIWVKLMRAMMKAYPGLNIATLTREEAINQQLPCISIASAIDAGYLPAVPGYQGLTAMI